MFEMRDKKNYIWQKSATIKSFNLPHFCLGSAALAANQIPITCFKNCATCMIENRLRNTISF